MDCFAVYVYCDHPRDTGVMEFQLLCICANREDAIALAKRHSDTTQEKECLTRRETEYDAPFREDIGIPNESEKEFIKENNEHDEPDVKRSMRIAVEKLPYVA